MVSSVTVTKSNCKKLVFLSSRFRGLFCTRRSVQHSQPGFDGITLESVKKEFIHYEGGSITLKTDDSTGIATVTLSHPERRNAISGRMMCELHDIVGQLELWAKEGLGRAVILKSDDSQYFCSGADLKSTVKFKI